jgi:hypothetical protein
MSSLSVPIDNGRRLHISGDLIGRSRSSGHQPAFDETARK